MKKKNLFIIILVVFIFFMTGCFNSKTYKVSFDTVGGSVVETQKIKKGNTIVEPDNPIKEGHAFVGWFNNDEKWDFSNKVENDLTLVAKWDLLKFIITFDSNGGNEIETQNIEYGKLIKKPANPTKTNYVFKGWLLDDQLINLDEYKVTNDITLVAKWEFNPVPVNVKFVFNNGTQDENVSIFKGELIDKPTDVRKEGHDFVGWFNNDKLWDFEKDVVMEDITLVAKWKIKKCTITFDMDGGTEIKSITLDYNSKVPTYMIPSKPKKEGCYFTGWDKKIPTVLKEDITLKAQWGPELYVLFIFLYEGKNYGTLDFYYGEEIKLPEKLERKGYTFIGWDKEVPKTMPAGGLSLTGQWKINQYTITFDTDGGSKIDPITQDYDSIINKPTDPIKSGYVFNGWDKEIPDKMPDYNQTIKAKWFESKQTFDVTFLGFNNEVLKTEKVRQGFNANPPVAKEVEGYNFIRWDINYKNVQSNLTVKAVYEKIDYTKTFNIIYNLNGGNFGYYNKNDYVLHFLKDFYNFVKPTESLNKFIYGNSKDKFLGTWKEYVGGAVGKENKLLYNNNLTLDNEDYFFNCKKYKEKWANLGEWVQNQNNRFAGNNYQYGALDFYRYIINDPAGYINVYGDKFYKYPTLNEPTVTTFKYSQNPIKLHSPLSTSFKGWYLNSDFSGSPVFEIPANTTKDFEVYAKWDNTRTFEVYIISNNGITYDPITVEKGDEVTLPTIEKADSVFLGWYYNHELISNPFIFNYDNSIKVEAKWKSNYLENVPLEYNNVSVKYRGTDTTVMIPNKYVQPKTQLRAAWVSSYINDFTPSTIEANMKNNLIQVLDLLESYNMNCVIFHIRTSNNAYYKTQMTPIDYHYGDYQTFQQWDYLEWFIKECHKRGMEFHAWMNPYRIKATGATSPEDIAKQYSDYPFNPASNKENILMTSNGGAILNPAKEDVVRYLIDTCLEVISQYDVDAIHFDDYFYAQMDPINNILKQPDQKDFEESIKNHSWDGDPNSTKNKAKWRRFNITYFISRLHSEIDYFNETHNRKIQFGISPTGIYKNRTEPGGFGSNTTGQEHFESYLYCSSLQWAQDGLIDYLMPQSYWGFTHPAAGYADVMDWWNECFENLKARLYSGIGLYMGREQNKYSWSTQPYEISNQILYTTKLKNVDGVSIFSLKQLRYFDSNTNTTPYLGLQRIKNEYWKDKVPCPSK